MNGTKNSITLHASKLTKPSIVETYTFTTLDTLWKIYFSLQVSDFTPGKASFRNLQLKFRI